MMPPDIVRSGKWTPEEEVLANRLVLEFAKGTLPDCENGCTLRSYLARKLNCAPMRISKKFAGRCIGKTAYVKKDILPEEEVKELMKLEKDIYKKSYHSSISSASGNNKYTLIGSSNSVSTVMEKKKKNNHIYPSQQQSILPPLTGSSYYYEDYISSSSSSIYGLSSDEENNSAASSSSNSISSSMATSSSITNISQRLNSVVDSNSSEKQYKEVLEDPIESVLDFSTNFHSSSSLLSLTGALPCTPTQHWEDILSVFNDEDMLHSNLIPDDLEVDLFEFQ